MNRPPFQVCRHAHARERGSMLIVALGILTLMSLLAVTFVILMNLERAAAANYVDSIKAKMAAEAGIQRVVADIHRLASKPLFAGTTLQPFVYHNDGKVMDVAYPVEKLSQQADAYFYGRTGRSYSTGKQADADLGVGVDEYRVKVIDTSALVDLNVQPFLFESGKRTSPLPRQTMELVLEALGKALIDRFHYDPIAAAVFDGPNGHTVGAAAIVAFRSTLDGQRFSTKAQLQEILPEDAFRIVRDYVTCHGWRDDKAVITDASARTLTHHAVELSPRPPINANLAPKECLVAAIAPIAGRQFVMQIDSTLQAIEQDDQKRYFPPGSTRDPTTFPLQETNKFDSYQQGFVFLAPFNIAKATKIADWIISKRPIHSYSHFYALVKAEMDNPAGSPLDDAVTASLDPGAHELELFPPQAGFVPGENIAAVLGPPPAPWLKSVLRQAGYSLLLANFGATFTPSDVNPSSATYLPIDKSSLVWPQDPKGKAPQGTLIPRQTYDFCFDTRGTFEVTSLGQIRGKQGEVLAQEKLFTVVKVMDQVTHRSQYDFERNEDALTQSHERSDYTTYPENKLFFAPSKDNTLTKLTTDSGPVPYGHLEVAPRLRYDNGMKTATSALAHANFGQPRFALFFDGPKRDDNIPPGSYLNADCYNGADNAAVYALPRASVPAYARARGKLPTFMMGPRVGMPTMPWDEDGDAQDAKGGLVLGGRGALFADGFYTSYRHGYDKTLWYRAGAGRQSGNVTDETNDDVDHHQGALAGPDGGATDELTAGAQDPVHQGNLFYRRGGIEFWYKPDYDWSFRDASGTTLPMPLFCGLACGTRVFENPGLLAGMAAQAPYNAPPYGPAPMMRSLTEQGPLPTDGTQFFIFRNTDGFLRATRIFFRCVGDPQDTHPGTCLPIVLKDPVPGDQYGDGKWFSTGKYVNSGGGAAGIVGAVERYREAATFLPYSVAGGPGGTPTGYPWPPAEMKKDLYEIYGRVDAWVPFDANAIANPGAALSPLAKWKSNEWHHIAVCWDDGLSRTMGDYDHIMRIYVDGVFASQAYGLPENPNGPKGEDQFCRCNEPAVFEQGGYTMRLPRDSLYIGGIERRLARLGGGVFKHDNTIPVKGNTPDVDNAKHVQLFACGTLDDVIVYDGSSRPPGDFFSLLIRYQPLAQYAQWIAAPTTPPNAQTIPDMLRSRFPDGTKPLELAKLSWEVLLPTHHGGQIGKPEGVGSVKITIDSNSASGLKLEQPGGAGGGAASVTYDSMYETLQPSYAKFVGSNGPAYIRPGEHLKYNLAVKASDFSGGKAASKEPPALSQIDTPAVTEVSVSYFLPVEDTLLKERVVD